MLNKLLNPSLLTVASCFALSILSAEAADSMPFSVSAGPTLLSKAPTDYPSSAGSGMGLSVFAAPFSTWKNGVEASAWTQAKASFLSLQYRHYVAGTAQYSPASRTNSSFKQKGWFIQGGAVLYNLVRTEIDPVTGSIPSASPNLYRVKGFGAVVGMGWERPFWKSSFIVPRLEYVTSINGPANFSGINVRLQIGIPITLY